MTPEIWQAAIWVTLVLVFFSVVLQLLTKRSDHNTVEKILDHNKSLSENIMKLHQQIMDLNKDLVNLSNENKVLSGEITKLNIRVDNLQKQVSK
jgi:predicted  nucleic acid-binding Zn-ribbon protein